MVDAESLKYVENQNCMKHVVQISRNGNSTTINWLFINTVFTIKFLKVALLL